MAIVGKIAMLATLRVMLGEHHFAGGSATPAALAFPVRASPSAPAPLHHLRARSAAARSSVAFARVTGGNPYFGAVGAGQINGADAKDATGLGLLPLRARSAAARSSVAVARVSGGNPYFGAGGAGKSNAADPNDATSGLGRGDGLLGVEEAREVARIVAIFLFWQKAFYLRDKKLSEIKRKILMVVLICDGVWVGFMAVKGEEWAVTMAGAFDKGDKIYKIVSAILTVFK